MSFRKSKYGRALLFQQLENRMLMTGNVTVAVRYGSLVITGDSQTDAIFISQTGSGQYSVAPFAGTTINGQATAQTFSGVTGDFNINLKGGADVIQFQQPDYSHLTLPGNVKINLSSSAGSYVLIENAAITGGVSITDGADGSTVFFEQSQIGGDCKINLGGGNDAVELDYTAVARDLAITMNKFSSRADSVELMRGVVGHNATIQTGNGNDRVQLVELSVQNQLRIRTGGGDDIVALGELTFDGTQGEPSTQTFVNAATITVDMGSGNDVLRMFDVGAQQATCLGGDGVDAVFDDGPSSLFGSFSGFETMPHIVPIKIVALTTTPVVAMV